VLDGLLAATAARPRVLAGALPRDAARIVTSAGVGGARAIDLPVVEAGSGLVRAEAEAVAALARERFARTARTAEPVRLVVLNGNGIPGIGERVARKLVPAGFRLVSSQNASTFDVKETLIAATDERFLDEARLARELLGVGRVALDPQSSRVAEVTVIVGRDFRAA
ncbi:MAG TPA: LytR C-terminal domain-containing protein, partial [Actinomycetota bacterium]|nr:LytR C-terminal domain-containing protein [Actinomycetota bacterium]